MNCPLPNLSLLAPDAQPDEPVLLEYDVMIDEWRMSDDSLTPSDLNYQPISVFPDPVILGFEGEMTFSSDTSEMVIAVCVVRFIEIFLFYCVNTLVYGPSS